MGVTWIGTGRFAAAAGESQGGAITIATVGAAVKTGGVATMDVAYTSAGTISSGQKLLLWQVLRTSANDDPSDPSGWTRLGTFVGGGGGTGNWGSQTGDTRATVWEKTATGSESGNVTITWTNAGAAAAGAGLIRLTGANAGWQTSAFSSGEDLTGPAISVTGSSTMSFLTNDLLLCINGVNTEGQGVGSEAISAAGITFSAVTVHLAEEIASGNRAEFDIFSAAVTAGSATVAPTGDATWTGGTPNPSGVMAFARIRNAA